MSIVGFVFNDTRVSGFRIPFHVNFEEVNLRFYVRRRTRDEVRRGVVFIKEIVPKTAIALVARLAYNENYVAMTMKHRHALWKGRSGQGIEVEYSWRSRGRWNNLGLKAAGEPEMIAPGSEQEFIAEHYWGYSVQRDGGTVEYRVEHPRWRAWRAGECWFDCDIEGIYGPEFRDSLTATPCSAFLAEGSEVTVFKGARL